VLPYLCHRFCHGIDCPHYEVVKSFGGYEEREYDASMWAVTEVESIFLTKATLQGFKVSVKC